MKRAYVATTALIFLLCSAPSHANDTNKGQPPPAPKEKGVCSGTANVGPGQSASNNDGVQVTTNAASNGSASLTPQNGSANCASLVNGKAGWSGSATGLDGNDTALVAPGSSAVIAGTGGTVSISAGCNVNVINVGGPGAGNMTVNHSGGPTILLPGQSQQFNT